MQREQNKETVFKLFHRNCESVNFIRTISDQQIKRGRRDSLHCHGNHRKVRVNLGKTQQFTLLQRDDVYS